MHTIVCCTCNGTGNPIGFASHEFVGTTCPDFAASRLDRVYAGSSYGLAINGPNPNPRLNRSTVKALKSLTNHTRAALTWERYATGIKSGFPYCANASVPSTCIFDDTARETIDWMGQELGTNHIGYWVNEATSQAEWDAWGYFLQGKSPPPPPPSPPAPGPSPHPHGDCKIHHTIGCYNDTDWRVGKPGLVLPAYQASLHGRISLESCAAACDSIKMSVAGVNDGSGCFCGAASRNQRSQVASARRQSVWLLRAMLIRRKRSAVVQAVYLPTILRVRKKRTSKQELDFAYCHTNLVLVLLKMIVDLLLLTR